jgi:lipopolysaccharide export system permease protein
MWRYLAQRYLVQILLVGGFLFGLIYIFETLELLRRAGGHNVPTSTVLGMAALKLPETAQVLFPFIFLVSGLSLFWQLGRASELIVMRAVGISAWQFIAPIALTAFVMGVMNVGLLQPLSATSLNRYAALESQYLGKKRSVAALNEQGLWLRDNNGDVTRLLHARTIGTDGQTLSDIMVLNLNENGVLQSRLDAEQGRFDEESWLLRNGARTDKTGARELFATRMIETGIKRSDMFSGFNEAATFSFWSLPGHIRTMAASGFPTRTLNLYYQNLLAVPFLWLSMALIAAVVSLTPHRLGKTALMIGVGVAAGFFYFLFARYFEALSLVQRIPPSMAAWMPVVLATLVPLYTLLKKEDG